MMDNEQERNEHFQGFAELLYQELSELEGSDETLISEYRNKYDKQDIVRLIAQRAYDLVYHAFMTASTVTLEHANLRVVDEEDIKDVPDMIAWPPTPQEP